MKQLRFNYNKTNLRTKSYIGIISLLLIFSGSNLFLDMEEYENTATLDNLSDSQLSRTSIPEGMTSEEDSKENFIPYQDLVKANIDNLEDNLAKLYDSSANEMISSIFEDNLGRIWVVYSNFTGSNFGSASDSDICGQYTTDGGITWSEPKMIIDRPGGKEFGLSTTIDSEGKIWLFWFSTLTNGDNYDIWRSYSADDGTTWVSPVQMTNNATAMDFHTGSFTTQNGTIWVVFAADRDGLRNLYYFTSPDNGNNWSSMKELPISDPGILQQLQGNAYVTNNGTILLYGQEVSTLWASFLYKSVDNGATWTKHIATAYNQHLNGGVYADENFNIFIVDLYINGDYNLYITNSTNGGTTWSTPEAISSSNGKSDDGIDFFLDSHGTLWSAFHSNRDGDFDIYYKKFEDFDLRPQIKFVNKWGSSGSGDGQFNYPTGIAVNSSGHVFVADAYNHRIQVFDPNGNFVTKWGSSGSGDGQFLNPCGIAINTSDYVYVADTSNNRIQVFDSNRNFITKWGSSGSSDGQFDDLYGISINTSGYVYATDYGNNRVQVFNANGNFITKWGSSGSGDGQFNYPIGITVNSSGHVFVADDSNHRIQAFDANGNFITKWGSFGTGDGQFNNLPGIAVSPSGHVFVTDHFNHRIQVFNSDGTFITKWGSFGSGDGQFNRPYGITVGSSGKIFVADYYNYRIQVFEETTGFFELEPSSFLTYYDDFNDGDISDWSINSGDWYADSGMLRINNTATGANRYIKAPITAVGDWEASVNVYWTSGSYFEGMLFFDANFSATYPPVYDIHMSTYSGNWYYVVYYELGNSSAAEVKTQNATSVSTGTWYELSAKRVGSTLFFYLNEILMYTEHNAVDLGIEFALSSASFMPEVIYFDNFTVHYYELGGNSFPTLDSPVDVNYEEGQTGSSITWTPSDADPARYNVTRDSVLIKSGAWNSSGETITITIDGLSVGTHTFRCYVYDSTDQSTFDEVIVTVQSVSFPTGYITVPESDGLGSLFVHYLPNGSYAVYPDGGGNIYRTLTNDFISWSTQETFLLNAQQMQIYQLQNGTYILLYYNITDVTIYIAQATDAMNWGPATKLITETGNNYLSQHSFVQLSNGTLVLVYINDIGGDWVDVDRRIISSDDGITWSSPRTIFHQSGSSAGTSDIFEMPNGTLFLGYWTMSGGNWDVEGLVSHDRGQTWSTPITVAGSGFRDYHATFWLDSNNVMHAVYYVEDSTWDVWETNSTDLSNWSTPKKITDLPSIEGHPTLTEDNAGNLFYGIWSNKDGGYKLFIIIKQLPDEWPSIDSPTDVTYEAGQTGNSITWSPSDTDPASYNITRDSVLINSGTWNTSGETITISVDGLSAGTYTYRCYVNDTIGQSTFDEVTVTVQTNNPPTIDSPTDVSYEVAQTGYSITWTPLDTDPASYNITQDDVIITSGTWNSSGETITISVDGLSAGTYTYRCYVNDSIGQSTFDELTVTVQPNNPPTIDSPTDVSYEVAQTGYSITWTPLDTDPVSYQITRNGSLLWSGSWNSSGETIVANIDGLGVGNYSYRCTVTDSLAQTSFDEVIVAVLPVPNPSPSIDSPPDDSYEEATTGHSIIWNPTDNDPSTYQITRNESLILSGTWNFSGEAITINIDGLIIGTYIYRCTVTDSDTQSTYDEVEISVYNNPPLINSPNDISYEENTTGYTISWDSSDTDPSSYEIWRNTTLIKTGQWNSSGEIITINVDGLSEGNYSLQCKVFDSRGQSISDDVLVVVTVGPPINFPPTIDSPSDSSYEYMTSDHSIIWNPSDMNPESYQITRNGSLLTSGLWNSSSEQIIVSIDGLAPATYIFRCTVFDNGSLSVYDEVEVIVINSPPNIDTPLNVSYEENETGYGIVWNPHDSDPMSYQITRNGSLIYSGSWNSSGEIISINVDGLSPGTYIYRCLVFDSFSQSVFNEVTVHVTALPPENLPPTLNAPMDIIYEEGLTGYTITWIASDLEDPDSYSIYRDGVLLLSGSWNSTGESITANVDGLSYANYTYQCVVYDGQGQTATDLVNVIVTKVFTIPSPPQNLQAVAGDTQVELSWDIPVDNGGAPIIEYRIYRSTSPSHYSLIGTSTTLEYLDNSVANGLTYYYTVRAVNIVGESLDSNSVVVVPRADETTTAATSTSTTTVDTAPNLTQGLTYLWVILPMLLFVVTNHRRRKN